MNKKLFLAIGCRICKTSTPLFVTLVGLVSCTAKVYVMDRHTIMEEEAAGEWPDFEKELLRKSAEAGPTAFQKTETSAKKQRLYNVLNAEPTAGTNVSKKGTPSSAE